ncbi:hypothetical protein AB0F91_45865 [Amycolatopsis sp. NPDC023774]
MRRILAADDLIEQRPGPDAARFRRSAELAEYLDGLTDSPNTPV